MHAAAAKDGDLRTRALIAASGVIVIASTFGGLLPLLVGILSERADLTLTRAGYVVAANLAASVVGTTAYAALSASLAWSSGARWGLACMLVGNMLCTLSPRFAPLLAAGVLASGGAGMARGVAFGMLGRTANPARWAAIVVIAQTIYISIGALVTPRLAAALGWRAPFQAMALLALIGLGIATLLPMSTGRRRAFAGGPDATLSAPVLLALVGVFFFFVGQGALWSYVERIGATVGLAAQTIARAISLSSAAGLVGASIVGVLGRRLRTSSALQLGLGLTLVGTAGIARSVGATEFSLATCTFYFAWSASVPYQFAVIAARDASGKAIAMFPAVDMIGLAAGPALAAALILWRGLGAVGWLSAAGSVLGIFALWVVDARFASRAASHAVRGIEEAPP